MSFFLLLTYKKLYIINYKQKEVRIIFIQIDWQRIKRFLEEAAEEKKLQEKQKQKNHYQQIYFIENTNIEEEIENEKNDD